MFVGDLKYGDDDINGDNNNDITDDFGGDIEDIGSQNTGSSIKGHKHTFLGKKDKRRKGKNIEFELENEDNEHINSYNNIN